MEQLTDLVLVLGDDDILAVNILHVSSDGIGGADHEQPDVGADGWRLHRLPCFQDVNSPGWAVRLATSGRYSGFSSMRMARRPRDCATWPTVPLPPNRGIIEL
jgi:hypothetical protein